ncbi:MAG: hypothetical protein LUD78_10090 [Clostridiales bacterium]|nr:hypothetical protein [Clostridiales bacterium]
MKRTYTLRLDGQKLRLRLTVAGQRTLREKFGEEPLQIILSAATDGERMAALLEEALNWRGNDNGITDGEALYDLLVDEGWSGQARFGALAFDIAAQSGLVSQQQAEQLKRSVAQAVEQAFQLLEDGEEAPEEKETEERPFPAE